MMNYLQQNLNDENTKMFAPYLNSGEIFEVMVAFEDCTLPREKWTPSA
jgi:hypothetical protein